MKLLTPVILAVVPGGPAPPQAGSNLISKAPAHCWDSTKSLDQDAMALVGLVFAMCYTLCESYNGTHTAGFPRLLSW